MSNQFSTYKIYAALAGDAYLDDKQQKGQLGDWKFEGAIHNSFTGFDIAVYSNGNEKVIAFRGTDLTWKRPINTIEDLINDIQLAIWGDENFQSRFDLKNLYNELAEQGYISSTDKIVVTGHSLGGYLAQLFTIANEDKISHTYTYNAPGLGGARLNFLRLFGIESPIKYNSKITDIVAKDFANLIHEVGMNIGEYIEVSGDSHAIKDLTQILYFYDMAISNGVNENAVTQYLSGFYNTPNSLFSGSVASIASDTISQIEQIVGKANGANDIIEICNAYETNNVKFRLDLIAPTSSVTSFFSGSNLSTPALYALVNLNPFIVSGVDSSAYSELEKFKDEYSGNYVSDKAKMLEALLGKSNSSAYYSDLQTGKIYHSETIVDDATTDEYIVANKGFFFGTNSNDIITGKLGENFIDTRKENFIYTLAGDDRINLSSGSNYIEAGSGSDYIDLSGIKDTNSTNTIYADLKDSKDDKDSGNDIIIGSAGKDTMYGGSGNDKYYAGNGDTIEDDDKGQGEVYFNGTKLSGGYYDSETGNYTDGTYEYRLGSGSLTITHKDSGESITINNFTNDINNPTLGIILLDEITIKDIQISDTKEKSQKQTLTVTLSRDLLENETLNLALGITSQTGDNWHQLKQLPQDNPNELKFELVWLDDEIVGNDETFKINASGSLSYNDTISQPNSTTQEISINATIKPSKDIEFTIQDDDKDPDDEPNDEAPNEPDSPNDTFPDTDPASTKTSPIVIDLNNDGVKTISRKNNKIYFDLDNNKFAQNTSWIDSNDGILINKSLITDNNITNGSQLFGNHTLLTNGNLATNGFEALKEFDENNDGVINKLDQNAYENLAIWQDINSNAKLDTNELKSLKELGIKEINLNYTNSNFIDENGNEHRQTSSVVFENGNKASISDVWLDTLNADTKYVGEKISLSNEIRALPQVYAFGEVLNLRQAMAQDEVLKAMVQSYVVSDKATQNEMINDIIYRWTGSDQTDPNSRDPKQIYSHVMDARMLVALEHLTGKGYVGTWCWGEKDPNPHGQAAPLLIAEFNKFVAYTQAQISAQSKYKELFADILPLQWEENQTGDLSVAFGALRDKIANLLPNVDYTMISAENIIQVRELIKIAKNLGTYNTKYQSVFKTIESEWLSEIENFKFVNSMVGTDGNDSLNGDDKDNIIIGGRGNDTLFGEAGDDMYYFDIVFGKDRVYDSAGVDSIVFSENVKPENIELTRNKTSIYITRLDDNGAKTNDIIQIDNFFEYNGDIGNGAIEKIAFQNGTQWDIDKIIENLAPQPTQGNDNLFGDMKDNILSGLDGDDTIYGGNGNDTINGDDGNDTLYGDNGNDALYGGAGNDTLDGGNGNDVYIFNIGDGNDTITGNAGTDTIKFGEGISKEDITITRINYNDLKLTFKDNQTDSITLKNGAYSSVIENVEFASGETLKLSDLVADITGTNANDILYAFGNTVNGGDGNDTIYGSDKADTIIGGKGNDSLNGGNGNDVYIFNIGDGNDTITGNAGTDTIKFGEGISKEDLIIKKPSSNAIKICFKNNSTDNITLSNLNIENFEFANGDKLTFNDIKELPLYSSDENETIYGYNDKANIINALGGNDSVYGGNANDTLNGGDGNDTISAGNGNDTIKGGTGNDNLQGGNGDDIYVFNKGDGVDTIVDWHGNDTIKFNDFNQEDIELKRELTSLVITSKISDDKIVIQNFFDTNANTSNPIKKIIFKDSSEWNLNEILANATIKATDGNDKFYLTPNDDEFDALGGDDTIYAGNGNDNVNGNDGNDTLYADNGNDTLSGGTGNDKLYGGYGNDTYIYNLGDGDDTIEDIGGSETIKFSEGISKDDLIVQKVNNSSLKISFKNSSGSLMLNYAISNNNYAIENFEFANGDKLTFNDIKALSLIGSDENDTITGYNDMGGVIIGAKGNDSLNGGNKDEVYRYNLGDGDDTITERGGNNIIEFGEGISKSDISVVRHYNGLKIFINNENNQGSITITNDVSQAEVSLVPISEIKFANGETLIFEEIRKLSLIGSDNNETIEGYWELDNIIDGKAGNDTIYGGNKNDTLIGSFGNDSLNGGNGNDTYIYNKGDGNDTISDTAGNDTIEFGEGISKDDIIISTLNNSGSLKISFKNDDGSITFSTAIENIKFANGETLNLEEIKTLSLIGKDSNDKIYGFANRDNKIQGNAGDDELNGNNANDTLIGGKGNDKLNGGNGNDTYIFNIGDGKDEIYEESGNDIIEFGKGISKDSLIVIRDGENNLKIYVKDNPNIPNKDINLDEVKDIITLKNVFSNNSSKPENLIETIKFQDGSTLNFNDIKKLSLINSSNSTETLRGYDDENNNIVGNDADETIYGGELDDTINAGAGNDTITAYSGKNTLIGGSGDDVFYGDQANNTYIFSKGDGNDKISGRSSDSTIKFEDGISKDDIKVTRGENLDDLVVKINENDSITIKNFYHDGNINKENEKAIVSNFLFANGEKIGYEEFHKLSYIGKESDDTIYGLNSNDTIKGNDGDDTLYGEYGNDTLIGGTGNDTLQGGDGDDTYIFNLGDGKDEIYESSGNDTIEFGKGISKDSLIVIRDGENNLKIYVKDNPNIPNKDINLDEINDVITLKDVFSLDSSNSDQIIESVKFNDSSTISFNELKKMSMLGLDNNQTNIKGYDDMENIIKASQKDTTIQGGDLKDTIYGGQNNDIINANDGNDTVYGNGGDDIIYGGSGDDILYGNEGNDTISDFEGNNKIFGGDGDDIITSIGTIYGNSGNDTIKTFTNNYNDDKVNTIYGGTGNDTLNGGAGSDIYMFNSNDGADIITDDGGDNTVKFTDINKDNITVKRGDNLNDLVIITDNNDSITIKNFYTRSSYKDENGSLLNAKNGNGIINKFIFADQTELNYEEFHKLSYNGKDSDDLIYGLNSNDFINGGKGNDTIYARNGDDTLYGNDGDDILNGDLGNDTLIGGTGNDTLQGGDGDDKYIFNLGDGKDEIYDINGNDTIEFGNNITKDSLIVIRDGENNLKIYVKDNPNIPNKDINLDEINDVITLKDVFSLDSSNSDQIIESVKFNDGSTISFNEIKKLSILGIQNNQAQIIGYDDMENLIKASNNDTVIQGGNLKDTIYGGNGNDVLNANAGDDTVYGGNGDDEIYGGDGDDTLYGNSGNDTVNGGLGDDIIYAGEGNDILNGDLGNDILVGGSGNDTLLGGDGDDTYIFNLGDGKDIITERELSEPYLIRQDSFDTVKFTKGVNKDDILLSRNGDDLIIKNKTNGDEITVKNHFFLSNRYYKINSIEFDDGTIWDEKYIDHNAVYYGSDANDELSGYMGNDDIIKADSGNDTIYGFDGDDEIYGEDGDDYLSGGNGIEKNTGNDKLYGGAGNDQLRGEDGNDYLNGGSGDDRYYYSYGDGFDTIENEGGGSDSLIFFDITRDRLSFSKEENDLIINIDNDANQGVRVKNYFLNDEYALDMIQPGDQKPAYTKNDIDNIVNAFDKPTLTEDKNANIIDTKNDEILQGSDKNNTYYYHGGKDLIVDSGGIDTLKFMINGYHLNFSSNGTDLSLSLGNIQDENNNNIVTIKDFFANENSIVETIQLKNGYKFSAKDIYQSFGKEYPKDDSSNTTDPQPNENNLVGGNEDNKYIFSGGQKTVIDSGGNDTIKFTQDGNGLNFSTNGTDLTLNVYNHENDTITVKNFFTNPSNIIEKFELKNGYTITSEQIYQSFGKEYPNSNEPFGVSADTANKIIEELNSYSNDNALNLNFKNETNKNMDIMQIYNV